ncbi:hypothetical protein HW511_07055 [Asaia siamensis]|uniref:Uncharacterized protein n=1 Tax=Asaia siamensis TaxID=110479 RepID=A0ABQ1LQQ5_9PROT|nr:hypothetical protein [Asaia siamensis]GGC27404.1 hypothetical protein GCM10007207_11100 [Asaia siamensis]
MALKRSHGHALLASLMLGGAALASPSALALTAKECHAKFQAAEKAGTMNGQKYKDFKAAQCGDVSTQTAQQNMPAAEKEAAADKPVTTDAPASPGAGIASKPSTASSGNVVFPTAVSPQYAKLSAGKARMKTCLDQYHANQQSGGNGSLKWIQKGGGYYSQCNAKLK